MPRNINADALIAKWEEEAKHIEAFDLRGMVYAAINDVKRQPTVDAVEVVRCRDCEWYKTNYSWNGKERKVCGIEPFEPIRREEDYCAYGERRE